MKIGIIAPADLPVPAVLGGAVETLIENYIKENEEQGLHEIVVYSKYYPKSFEVSLKYFKSRFVWIKINLFYDLISLFFKVLRKIKVSKIPYDVWLVYQKAKYEDFDVIIVEGNPSYIKYLKTHLDPKCKVVFHIHALLMEGKYGYLADSLKFSDRIIVVSEYVKSNLLQRFEIDLDKIKVVYNCASDTFFNNKISNDNIIALKSKLGINSDDFVLIFAGRLVPEKGLLELIKAFKLINASIKLKLLIIGSFGSDFGKIINTEHGFKKIVENEVIGFENGIVMCGYIPNEFFTEYYNIADVVVIPSLCNDAAPLVAIEAMATSLPVIFSNMGGIKEYVSSKCGIMVEMDADNCVQQIANAIQLIHDNIELKRDMAEASLRNAQRYSPKHYYECLSNYFK